MKHRNFFSALIAGCLCLPALTQASTPLSVGCDGYGGAMHNNVTITDISASSLPSQGGCFYVKLSDGDYTYQMCPNSSSNFGAIQKMGDTALLIQNPVNVCTSSSSGGYLLGIEYVNA